jgi:hypothetical protein
MLTLPMSSLLMRASPAKFSSSPSISVSNVCKREVNAAPPSQIFSDPISSLAGASRRASQPGGLCVSNWPTAPRRFPTT